ncbi:AAA family ATPase [Methylomonas sp. EFPC1]|uniref:AAA family ATPase n=1 Tax=Methylomonas sp. EFPC1 TaxID=2812647 RepID=UPI0019689969|nr:AAA family ATPase [Methylomonas sp. EFPC1]QSB01073.1 AAA family ATPase [Methylomonas sp. EFPC1]
MLDNDDLTYSYQKRSVANNAERTLITLERSQKLDLLLHLLANLQQSLIVCGPEGIGKTTLLETVRQNRKDMWEVVLLPASPDSSFESLINDLLRGLNIAKGSAFDLSALRDKCARQKVVLLIDDAGNLVPGLMTMLIEFADSLPGLRLVLAMNHDQFHIKSGTDKLVEECHFIELPPLSKKQCGEYLQNLSAQPGAVVSFNAISDSLIEDLYRASNGIPGKILAQLPKFAHSQSHKRSKLGLWLAIAGVLAGAGYALKSLLPPDLVTGQIAGNLPIAVPTESVDKAATENTSAPQPTPTPTVETVLAPPQIAPPPEPKAPEPSPTIVSAALSPANNTVESSRALIEAEATGQAPLRSADTESINNSTTPSPKLPNKPSSEAISTQPSTQSIAADKQTAPAKGPNPEQAKPEQQAEKPSPANAAPAEEIAPVAVPTPAKPVEHKPAKPAFEGSDQDWIMAQPANNFTLQVMVLSTKDAALRFQKKYADYRDGLKFYPIKQGEQEKYVVIYGSFQSAAEAIQLKAVMPGEFKQAMEKRFRAVQKESRR